jgi:hypothetical protein
MAVGTRNNIPPDPTDDPIQPLLDVADVIAETALSIYAGPRTLTPEQGRGLFVFKNESRAALVRAADGVLLFDFGPRAPQAGVIARVKVLGDAVRNVVRWAIRHHGRKPAPWKPATEEEAADPAKYGPPPDAADQAEGERLVLWRELEAAKAGLTLLRVLGPTEPKQGPVPPDRFRWHGAEASGLSRTQYRLLAALCRGPELREPVPIGEVVAAVYEGDPKDKRAVAAHLDSLKKLHTRTQKELSAEKVRLWIVWEKSQLHLRPLGGRKAQKGTRVPGSSPHPPVRIAQ